MPAIAQMALWAALAIAGTAVSWRSPLAPIGLMLTICSLMTSGAYFGSGFADRLVLELMQACAIGQMARIAFIATKTWPIVIISALAVADAAVTGAISYALAEGGMTLGWARYYFGWATNSIFAVQCLCVAYPGVRDAVMGRFYSRDPSRCGPDALASVNDRSNASRWGQ